MDCGAPGPWDFPGKNNWSGPPLLSPRGLPDPGIKLTSPAKAGGFFTAEPPGKLEVACVCVYVSQSVVSDSLWPRGLCSPLGSSVHGTLQARTLEWVAIPFSWGSSRPRDRTWVSCIAGGLFTIWATRNPMSHIRLLAQLRLGYDRWWTFCCPYLFSGWGSHTDTHSPVSLAVITP